MWYRTEWKISAIKNHIQPAKVQIQTTSRLGPRMTMFLYTLHIIIGSHHSRLLNQNFVCCNQTKKSILVLLNTILISYKIKWCVFYKHWRPHVGKSRN